MGQCSPELVSKIRGSTTYGTVNGSQDVVELLRLVRGYCCDFGAGQQSTWALEQAKHKVSVFYQRHDVSNTDYIQFFQALVGVVETYGGSVQERARTNQREPDRARGCRGPARKRDIGAAGQGEGQLPRSLPRMHDPP